MAYSEYQQIVENWAAILRMSTKPPSLPKPPPRVLSPKKAAALPENTINFNVLADNSHDGILVSASENAFLYSNNKASELLGFSRRELYCMGFVKIIHPDYVPIIRKRYQRRLAGKPVANQFEVNAVHKQGHVIPIEISSSRTVWQGQLVVVAIIRDISSIRECEISLLESREKYRMLVETMNEGLAMIDKDGLVAYVNSQILSMIGFTRKEVVGKPASDLLCENNRKTLKRQLVGRRKGRNQPYELEINHKNGHKIPVKVSPQPIFDQLGKYDGTFAVLTDLTSLKKAEAILQTHSENFRLLADQANDAITIIIYRGNFAYANQAFARLSGYSPNDLVKQTFFDLVHPADRTFFREQVHKSLTGEDLEARYEGRLIRKDGMVFTIEVTAAKTIWCNQIAFLAILRDITERKRQEEKSAALQQELQQSVDKKSSRLNKIIAELKSKEKELANQQVELQNLNQELIETNKAISVLARNIDKNKKGIENTVVESINLKLLPAIKEIRETRNFERIDFAAHELLANLQGLSDELKNDNNWTMSLTPTETKVARAIKNGLTNQQIADGLYVSLHTIKTHRRNVRKKLNLKNTSINLTSYLRSLT